MSFSSTLGRPRVSWRYALLGILCVCVFLSACGKDAKKIAPSDPALLAATATRLAVLKEEFEALESPNGASESDDTHVRDFCARGQDDSTGEDTGALSPEIYRRWGGLDDAQRVRAAEDLRTQLLNSGWKVSDASRPLASPLSKVFDGWTGIAEISTSTGIASGTEEDRKGQVFLVGQVEGDNGCPTE